MDVLIKKIKFQVFHRFGGYIILKNHDTVRLFSLKIDELNKKVSHVQKEERNLKLLKITI